MAITGCVPCSCKYMVSLFCDGLIWERFRQWAGYVASFSVSPHHLQKSDCFPQLSRHRIRLSGQGPLGLQTCIQRKPKGAVWDTRQWPMKREKDIYIAHSHPGKQVNKRARKTNTKKSYNEVICPWRNMREAASDMMVPRYIFFPWRSGSPLTNKIWESQL